MDCLLFLVHQIKTFLTGQFGSLEWSATEKQLVYIAEKKLPKATSYFDAKNTSRTPDDETKPSETKARVSNDCH